MRKNNFSTAISLLLVFVMLAALAGCSSNKGTNETGKGSAQSDEVVGYPIVTDKSVTLRYWLTIPGPATAYISSSAENEVYIEMEKVTGIKVDYINPVGAVNEQFNLMIASGDIPDMISGGNNYSGGIAKGVDDGVYLDVTPLAQKYAPDYYKLINSRDDIRRQNTYDGKILSFNRVKTENDLPFRRLQTRTDWLEEAGMKEPITIGEWEAYLKFIAEKKKGVIPFLLDKSGREDNFMGVFNNVEGFYLKDGKRVDYGQIQPEFKEYLALMNKWLSYGYIPKDFNTTGAPQALKLYGSSKVAVFMRDTGNAFMAAKTNNFPHTTTPFPRLKQGDKLHWYNTDWTNTGIENVVSKSSKYQTEAIRWLNYGYTKDGILLFNYGVKDRMWVMENGKPKYTEYATNNPKYPVEAISHIGKLHFGPMVSLPSKDCAVGGEEATKARMKWMDDKDVDNLYVLPPVRLTLEEKEKRDAIMEEVNAYVNSMTIKFIKGEEPLSKYDEYVSQIKKLGIEEAIKVTQAAYERYMK